MQRPKMHMSHNVMSQTVNNKNSTLRMATDPLLYDFFSKIRNFGVKLESST